MNEANSNNQENFIFLERGEYVLTIADNNTEGPNGLPSVSGNITIVGVGKIDPFVSTITRDPNALDFRILHVAPEGTLTLSGVSIRGGFSVLSGGGILNQGAVNVIDSFITENRAVVGAGISNVAGTINIANSTISLNSVIESGEGGGIRNVPGFTGPGIVKVTNSAIVRNFGGERGGGIRNLGGEITLVSTTISNNAAVEPSFSVIIPLGGGGGIHTTGRSSITLVNSTVTQNSAIGGAGILNEPNDPATVSIQNTIVAGNTILFLFGSFDAPDCFGSIISRGNNIVGDPENCNIEFLETDLLADPRLGDFTDDGLAGDSHFPLLPDSPAINSANSGACPQTDQLGNARVGVCDRGSVEFQGQGPLLTVRRDVIRAGRSVVARWRAIPAPTSTDWIGLYLPGSSNTAFIDWIYVSCSKTAGNPDRRGSCDFPIPDSLEPGTYELRLLANDGFMRLASSDGFMVRPRREGLASQAP